MLVLLASIAMLEPEGTARLEPLARSFSDLAVVSAAVDGCGRASVAAKVAELGSDTAICSDGDVVSVWRLEGELRLVDAVPAGSDDLVARVTRAVRGPPSRVAVVFSLGPAIFASHSGASPGIWAQAELGVTRGLAVTAWTGIVPVAREITNQPAGVGTASYRPTEVGAGVDAPLLPLTSRIVPRVGGGLALLWVHTWPDTVGPRGVRNDSENLFSPVLYATAAASLRVSGVFRVALEGMLGVSTSNVAIRVAGADGAEWGQPLAGLSLRAEVVLP